MQEENPSVTEPPLKAEAPKPKATPLRMVVEKATQPIKDLKKSFGDEIGMQQALAVIEYGGLEQAKAAVPGLFGIKVEKIKKPTR